MAMPQAVVGRALFANYKLIGFGRVYPKLNNQLVGDATTNVFDGELTGDTIAGQFREGDAGGTFSIRRVDSKPPTFKQEEVSFRNGDVTLSGTLLLPLTKETHAAVVFLHGAGSEGRYAARFLAEYFTRHDIAALIYDKRGVGKSTGDWKRSDFTDLLEMPSLEFISCNSERKSILERSEFTVTVKEVQSLRWLRLDQEM